MPTLEERVKEVEAITGWTPGPWKAFPPERNSPTAHVLYQAISAGPYQQVGKAETSISPMSDWYCRADELGPNAALIAAAPDLHRLALDLAAERERLLAENARLLDDMQRIAQWADAYPLTVFPEPDWPKVHAALNAAGLTLDSIAASNMRHVVGGVGKIVRAALASEPRA